MVTPITPAASMQRSMAASRRSESEESFPSLCSGSEDESDEDDSDFSDVDGDEEIEVEEDDDYEF
jgi:hypothetical protein